MKEIFALDIGTRKVMGIVAQVVDGVLNIIDVEMIEHPSRSMFDGQIHSIDEVVKVVKTVKENLEERLKKNNHAIQPGQLSTDVAVNSYSDGLRERQALVNINGVPRVLTQRNFTLLLNGELASLNAKFKPRFCYCKIWVKSEIAEIKNRIKSWFIDKLW